MIRADDYPNLDQAVAAWIATGKGELVLGAKDYPLAAPISVPSLSGMAIRGEGDASAILPQFSNADVVTFGDGTTEMRNPSLEGFLIVSGPSAYAGVRLRKCVRSRVANVDVGTPDRGGWQLAKGFWFDGFDDLAVDDVQAMCTSRGIVLNGLASGWGADAWIGGGSKVMNASSAANIVDGTEGVHVGGNAGGVSIDSIDVILCGRGVVIATDLVAIANRELFLGGSCYVDSCGWDGVRALANSFGSLHLDDTWVASCGLKTTGAHAAYGVRVEPSQQPGATVKITGADIFNHQGCGVGINGGDLTMTGCTVRENGQGSAGGDGVGVYNAAVTANVSGNTIVGNGNSVLGRGVTIAAAALDVLVAANRVQGSGAVNLDFPSQGPRRVAYGNLTA